ncbi:MAG: integrase [Verrucomicrobiales bacterium]|jgi:integrase
MKTERFSIHGIAFNASPYGERWRLRWTYPVGKRNQRYFPTLAACRKFAKALAGQVRDGLLLLDGPDAHTWKQVTKELEGIDVPLVQIVREWKQRKASFAIAGVSLADAYARFIDDKTSGIGKVSVYRLRDYKKASKFAELAPDVLVDAIDEGQVIGFLQHWGKDKAPRTVFNMRNNLATFFEWCVGEGIASRNVITASKKLNRKRMKPDRGPLVMWTAEELRQIFATVEPRMVPVIALAAFGCCRTYEISRLDWSNVRFETGFLEVPLSSNRKTRKRRLYPMPENLIRWLGACRGDGAISPTSNGDYLADLIKTQSRRAGLDHKRNAHRHTCIAALVSLGKSKPEVAMWSGNSVDEIEASYEEQLYPQEAQDWFSIFPGSGLKPCNFAEKSA